MVAVAGAWGGTAVAGAWGGTAVPPEEGSVVPTSSSTSSSTATNYAFRPQRKRGRGHFDVRNADMARALDMPQLYEGTNKAATQLLSHA